MQQISLAQSQQLVSHVTMRLNETTMLWGMPGVGKSDGIRQVAVQHGAMLVDIRLSQYDSVDLRGFPGVDHQTGQTVWHPPSTLPFVGNDAFPDDRPILLFFDEVNAASPAVAAVTYQIINDRRCGEHVLKENVRIVCAGNRETDRGVTNRMPLPLANRMTHVEVMLHPDNWCLWAQEAGLPIEGVAFMQFRPALLSTFDPSKPDKAFATPRTWEKALKYYADDEMPADIKQAAMAGAVGDGPSAEFWGFVDVWQKMIPFSEIMKDPKKAQLPEKNDLSMHYAVAVNISGRMDTENADACHTYLCRMEPEFLTMAWTLASRRDNTVMHTDAFLDYAKRIKSVTMPGRK